MLRDHFPKYFNYGNNGNYGVHTLCFTIKGVDCYFSYKTLVAFRSDKTGLVCQKNCWGTTTGKHLNLIEPDHSKRVDAKEFEKLLKKV